MRADNQLRLLVIIRVTEHGQKERITEDSPCESAHSQEALRIPGGQVEVTQGALACN